MPVVVVASNYNYVWACEALELIPCLFKLEEYPVVCQITGYNDRVWPEFVDFLDRGIENVLDE